MNDTKTCDRCQADLRQVPSTMSRFNTEIVCLNCLADETTAPNYLRAKEAEVAAVRRGDYNFQGIGLAEEDRAYLEGLKAQRQPK